MVVPTIGQTCWAVAMFRVSGEIGVVNVGWFSRLSLDVDGLGS